jgi:hypothetical protein
MEMITEGNSILAIIYRDSDWVEGLNFITPNHLFLQAGSWYYQKGKKLTSHIHKEYSRTANYTQELVYVKQGSMKILLYDHGKKFKKECILYKGDLAVLVHGGHGYEILEDNTQILEAKNGPFIDVNTDKEKF